MRLTHNMYSLAIYKNYKTSLAQNSESIANISSGKKLNSAKDNPNKIADAERMKITVLSRKQACDNVQDTDSMLQTFDGALQEMNNNVARLKGLVVKAGNGTNSQNDLQNIQTEIDSVLNSMNDLANNTEFNGVKMSQANGTTKNITIGSESGDNVDIPFFDLTTGGIDSSSTGLGIKNLDVTGPNFNIDQALNDVDSAVTKITGIRSKYGALQSRLEGALNNFDEINDVTTSAESSLEDADMATESLKNSTSQILINSAISLMVQSNQLPQDALNILARVK
ncbi:flagellin [Clostridium sp.]|uniref:flagellin n=1 Tax=Clostridium sp. TaxID=1506 RepID=UPI00263819A5|nr:flagellin [Clostridium sp.]